MDIVSQWFIQQMDVEIGPMNAAELLQRVRQGSVTEQTMIRKDDSAWFAAVEVGGLFDAASNRLREHHCPDCDSVVSKPPCVCSRCGAHLAYAPTRLVEETQGGTNGTHAAKHARRPSVQRWLQKINTPREEA